MLKNRMSFRVAFCGILAALMTVIMLVGPLIPTMTYVAPAAAGVFLIPVVWEFGGKAGGLLYAAVALLAFFLAPDKEAALCFVLLFGWYPVARPKLQHIRQKPVRLVVKLALFNAALLAIYALLLFVFVMPDLQQEAQSWTALLLVAFFVLGNVWGGSPICMSGGCGRSYFGGGCERSAWAAGVCGPYEIRQTPKYNYKNNEVCSP